MDLLIQLEMMPELPETRSEMNPWPEWPKVKKTDYGQSEAIAILGHDPRIYQTTVKEFIKDEKGQNGKRIFDLIMVTKYLERIGDHATNIAEWVEFSITGVHKDSAIIHEG